MGKGVEELRRILERMQKDLDVPRSKDSAAGSATGASRRPSLSPEPEIAPERVRPSIGEPFSVEGGGRARAAPQAGSAAFPAAPDGSPLPAAWAENAVFSAAAAIGPWERVLLLVWVAISLAGVLAGDHWISALGLLGVVWVVLRTSVVAAMRAGAVDSSGDLEDIALRVTALERRVAALKNTGGGAMSPKLQEDILELKTILKALFKALEEPAEGSEGRDEHDD